MIEVMLTTEDNPFDPFEDWDSWYAWDVTNGYNTCCYIDRIANVSGDMLPPIQAELLEEAIDEIVELNLTGNYLKITSENHKELMKNKYENNKI